MHPVVAAPDVVRRAAPGCSWPVRAPTSSATARPPWRTCPSAAWRTAKAGPRTGPRPDPGAAPRLPALAVLPDLPRARALPTLRGAVALTASRCAAVLPLVRHRARLVRVPALRGRTLRSSVVGARRTAEELGRAFAGVPVHTSGSGDVLAAVDGRPSLVIATPGAEPVAHGGYAATLLLDAWASLDRPTLDAAEEALRRWTAAAALTRSGSDGGVVVLAGAPDPHDAAGGRGPDPLGPRLVRRPRARRARRAVAAADGADGPARRQPARAAGRPRAQRPARRHRAPGAVCPSGPASARGERAPLRPTTGCRCCCAAPGRGRRASSRWWRCARCAAPARSGSRSPSAWTPPTASADGAEIAQVRVAPAPTYPPWRRVGTGRDGAVRR